MKRRSSLLGGLLFTALVVPPMMVLGGIAYLAMRVLMLLYLVVGFPVINMKCRRGGASYWRWAGAMMAGRNVDPMEFRS